ncbi:hypothetical protein EGW08_015919 [Elysia chlorotica]|uniref:Uncharacterized protein n=1 Tax=Elysia chlorotica TaxID=188477 RepID=A0A3S1BAX5_ELYCH|nr:hypothetical protein EGW08_015919 [Elysia chlorotica]
MVTLSLFKVLFVSNGIAFGDELVSTAGCVVALRQKETCMMDYAVNTQADWDRDKTIILTISLFYLLLAHGKFADTCILIRMGPVQADQRTRARGTEAAASARSSDALAPTVPLDGLSHRGSSFLVLRAWADSGSAIEGEVPPTTHDKKKHQKKMKTKAPLPAVASNVMAEFIFCCSPNPFLLALPPYVLQPQLARQAHTRRLHCEILCCYVPAKYVRQDGKGEALK